MYGYDLEADVYVSPENFVNHGSIHDRSSFCTILETVFLKLFDFFGKSQDQPGQSVLPNGGVVFITHEPLGLCGFTPNIIEMVKCLL